jgi:hypothetical protein
MTHTAQMCRRLPHIGCIADLTTVALDESIAKMNAATESEPHHGHQDSAGETGSGHYVCW